MVVQGVRYLLWRSVRAIHDQGVKVVVEGETDEVMNKSKEYTPTLTVAP
jgi:hypothetical protein